MREVIQAKDIASRNSWPKTTTLVEFGHRNALNDSQSRTFLPGLTR
jgi:hypothetical protein